MADVIDEDLYARTRRLLEPGDIELVGLVVHTGLEGDDDVRMHRLTVDVGDIIADHAGHDPEETFVYSGTDDPEFASNQHQGLTLSGESFVWECQQLLRDGTFDVVFYFEADVDTEGILADVRDLGVEATVVESP